VDIYYAMFQTLGERFVMVRWHRPPGEESALEAMNQNVKEARANLKEAVHNLFETLWAKSRPVPRIPNEIQQGLAALAEFVVRGRTHVMRNGYSKDIVYSPEPEAATRLAQQLAQLTRGSALLGGRTEANEEDYRVALRAGLDSIPAVKRKILDELIVESAGGWVRNDEGEKSARSTRSYALADLEEVGLVEGYSLSNYAKDLLSRFQRPVHEKSHDIAIKQRIQELGDRQA
jgi:hypothetical protein